MSNREIRAWIKRDKYKGGLTEFVTKDLKCKRLRKYELLNIKVIFQNNHLKQKVGCL